MTVTFRTQFFDSTVPEKPHTHSKYFFTHFGTLFATIVLVTVMVTVINIYNSGILILWYVSGMSTMIVVNVR